MKYQCFVEQYHYFGITNLKLESLHFKGIYNTNVLNKFTKVVFYAYIAFQEGGRNIIINKTKISFATKMYTVIVYFIDL